MSATIAVRTTLGRGPEKFVVPGWGVWGRYGGHVANAQMGASVWNFVLHITWVLLNLKTQSVKELGGIIVAMAGATHSRERIHLGSATKTKVVFVKPLVHAPDGWMGDT